MLLTAVKYSEDKAADWDNFIDSSINGSFLHKRGFYNSNPANKEDDHSLLFFKKNRLAAVLPGILRNEESGKVFHSHLRATYGGIIINEEIGVAEALAVVALAVAALRAAGATKMIIRNPFRIFYKRISDEPDYALWYHNFKILSREAEVCIDLTAAIGDIKKRYENGTKYNIKKAWKFVTAGLSEDFRTFWEMLEKNLEEKHGKKPVHSFEAISLLRKNAGADKILLFAAYHEEKMAAGCVVFIINDAVQCAIYCAGKCFPGVQAGKCRAGPHHRLVKNERV